MTTKLKSKPRDLAAAFDENLDPVERSSALARLRFDAVEDIRPLLVKLLKHKSFLLRRDAIVTLVGMRAEAEFLPIAARLLREDKDEGVRGGAAFALAQFVARTGEQKSFAIKELVAQLKREALPGVQEECYRALLKIVAPEKKLPTVAAAFKRERDVDWNLFRGFAS